MKTSRNFLQVVGLFLLVLATFSTLAGQSTPHSPSWFNQLSENTVTDITISTDLTSLLAGANEEEKAVISTVNDQGQIIEWKAKLSLRGKFRRRICDFPPIKIDLDKDELRANDLAEFDKLKLVTHCEEERALAHEQLLKESVTYQLYEQLTPYSYRTRLVRITYHDSAGNLSNVRRYGLILEPTKELAARLQLKECKDCFAPHPNSIDASSEHRLAVFQYMIGNTDYSIPMNRNVKLMSDATGKLIPIPYDFDFSGLVNASYAIPNQGIGQTKVQDRVFLGLPTTPDIANEIIQQLVDMRPTLIKLVNGAKPLGRIARTEVADYLTSFYDELDMLASYTLFQEQVRQATPSGGEPMYYEARR